MSIYSVTSAAGTEVIFFVDQGIDGNWYFFQDETRKYAGRPYPNEIAAMSAGINKWKNR